MFNHCLASSLTIIVIAVTNNQAFILQCQNCRCIPDYCMQTVPRSLCPCDGPKTPCSQSTAGMQGVQQPFVITQTPTMKYFLIQQPVQPGPAQIPGQLIMDQQQIMHALNLLQQQQMLTQQSRMGMEQPNIPPVYVIRTIEQPTQMVRQVQQIPNSMVPSQYMSAIHQIPIQQTQMMVAPSLQQMIPSTQQFVLPFQIPMQTVTLQVPVTMAEHCTPRVNACPVGLPSIHFVTECNNVTESAG
ncbi:hypothetical protein X798_01123 [Onchocerca flexuosa]|uniref:Uncharacterized protein n=1 Tax=Onchocerca flexuosa TaxID=387005 RepID=A0A238C396_9BILA|nr:hypothetical protein X798_01123 [Onchocerca flexuosa]